MGEPKPRPFLDTNVLISGLYSAGGPPAQLLRAHGAGDITIVVSRQVLEELVVAIQRKAPALLALLHHFLTASPPEVCPAPAAQEVKEAASCVNLSDAPILAAARKSGADCLVTGDSILAREAAGCAGITVTTPAAYVQLVRRRLVE